MQRQLMMIPYTENSFCSSVDVLLRNFKVIGNQSNEVLAKLRQRITTTGHDFSSKLTRKCFTLEMLTLNVAF